jgi:hypothetical protein
MVETGDHNIAAFDARNDPAKLADVMKSYRKQIKTKKKQK